jgi:hypothetical protein
MLTGHNGTYNSILPRVEISFSNNLYTVRDVQGRVFTAAGDTYTAIYHLFQTDRLIIDRS